MNVRTRHLALAGLLTAVAAVLSYMENFLPFLPALPGVKPGLANVVTLFSLLTLPGGVTLAIVVCRCALAALLGGNPVSLAFSLSGALAALLIMRLLRGKLDRWFSLIGVSMAGATLHNIAQLSVAALILRDTAVFSYLPVLMLSSAVTGILTALIAHVLMERFNHLGFFGRSNKQNAAQ